MIPYKSMYCILCSSISHAMDLLPENEENAAARWVLQKALTDAEEQFISASEDVEKEQ